MNKVRFLFWGVIVALLISGIATGVWSGEARASSGRKRIAIIRLEAPNDYTSTRLGVGVTDMLITALVKSGAFEVIERVQLDALLKEHNLSEQGLLDPATAVKAGKILGVDYLLGGKVSEFGIKTRRSGLGAIDRIIGGSGALGGLDLKNSMARVVLDLRLIEAETGKILIADTGAGEEKETGVIFAGGQLRDLIVVGRFDTTEWSESRIGKATRKAVDAVVQKVIDYFPIEGKVLAVIGSGPERAAILDMGRFSGLKAGMEIQVVHDEAVHDENGEVVWTDQKPVARLKVVEVQNDRAKAVAIGNGDSVAKGDKFILPARARSDAARRKKGA